MSEKNVLRVGTLLDECAGHIDLYGELHDVKQLTLLQHQALETTAAADSVALMREMVGELVPSLTREQIQSLTIKACKAITTLAGTGIEAIERLYPNAVSPAS